MKPASILPLTVQTSDKCILMEKNLALIVKALKRSKEKLQCMVCENADRATSDRESLWYSYARLSLLGCRATKYYYKAKIYHLYPSYSETTRKPSIITSLCHCGQCPRRIKQETFFPALLFPDISCP
jgi:hypothetical protein